MSEKTVEKTNEPNPEPNASETPSTEHPSGAAAEKTGFKYGAEAPTEWQGKTPAEAAEQYQQLKQAVTNYFAQQQKPPTETAVDNTPPADPDLWFSNPAEAEKRLETRIQQMIQNQTQQVSAPILQSSAEQAKRLSKSDPSNKPVWERYGSEIEQLVSQVSPQFQTNPLLWDQAAKIVKGQHADDFINERAQELAASLREGGVEGGSHSGDFSATTDSITGPLAKLRETDYGRDLLERFGERGLLRQLDLMGETIETYVEKVGKTSVTRNPENPGEWKSNNIYRNV